MKRILVVLMLFCASMAHAANEFNILDTPSSGGGGTPGGTSGQIQYNNGGTAFGGFGSYNSGTSTVTVPNLVATGSATVSSIVSTGAASLGATVVAAPFTVVSGGSTVASVVGNLLTVGSGTGPAAGVQMGYSGTSGFSGIWPTGVTPGTSNYSILINGTTTYLGGTSLNLRSGNAGGIVIDTNGTKLYPQADGALALGVTANRFSSAFLGSSTAITASAPAIDVAQTWNNGAVAFTAAKINVTNTASAAGSLLQDWQVGGVSKFNIRADGGLTLTGTPGQTISAVGATISLGINGFGTEMLRLGNVAGNSFVNGGININGVLGIGATAVADLGMSRLAADSAALGNGTAGDFSGALKLGSLTASAAAPTVSAGQVGFGGTITTTVGATGAASALPALPLGYLIANVAGTQVKIPYYNN